MNGGRAPIMIMAGGTGGHVYPALAVARYLQRAGTPVVWLGTRNGLEARVVPQAGIPIEWLTVGGLRGKSVMMLALAPFKLIAALFQAVRAVMKHRPSAVLGMGGFASGPGGVAARLLGRPLILHEQNAVAGLTNRLLAPLSHAVMTGFPGAFGTTSKAVYVGNPVRAEIVALPSPAERYSQRKGPLRVLVLGGSQGAKALNEVAPAAFAPLSAGGRLDVWHQAGPRMLEAARAAYAARGVEARVDAFIDDMAGAYAWADLVLCRAGALTVAELQAAGVASVLVPFPHAVDDHQTANGRYLEQAGAAILIPQGELDGQRLAGLLNQLLDNRERLLAMANIARSLAMPEADRRVAEACLGAGADRSPNGSGLPVTERRA